MSTRVTLLTVLLLSTGAPLASADTVTGRVVDENNVPVPDVDIDARGSSGDLPLNNDTTDINGNFTITVPADIYRFDFQTLLPTHVLGELDDVVVVGTVDLGDVVLKTGVQVSGRVVDTGLAPIFDVDLDAIDRTDGMAILLSGDNTDVLGNFSIVVPREVRLTFDTVNVVAGLFAPTLMDLTLTGNTVLPDVVLAPGFLIDGRVLAPGGFPVANADIDIEDAATEEELFTPRDNTDSSGNFSVIVGAGVWDVLICPEPGNMLVGGLVDDLSIGANTNVGNVLLENGFLLSGTIRDAAMNPVPNADVDVNHSGAGAPVVLCGDNADGAGFYSVLVPAGTWDIRFSSPTAFDIRANVAVSANTQLDGSLTPCSPAEASFRNGTGVNPILLTNLSLPRIGATWSVDLDCAGHAPSLSGLYIYANATNSIVINVGEILVAAPRYAKLFQPHSGNVVRFDNSIPPDLVFCDLPFFTQGIVLGAPRGQLSNSFGCLVGQ